MKPFCGYNFADYWSHWFSIGKKLRHPPRIYHVNWFRRDAAGKFLWPGFGDNLRVLEWMLDRCAGRAKAVETPIGYLPAPADLNLKGLSISPAALTELLSVDKELWTREAVDIEEYLEDFGKRVPAQMLSQLAELAHRIRASG